MSFQEANAILTQQVLDRLGEDVVLTVRGAAPTTVRAIVLRGVELTGDHGRVSDVRDTAAFKPSDVPDDADEAGLLIGGSENRVLDALVGRDGGMVTWSLR